MRPAPLPVFAIQGDIAHGPGSPRTRTDPWWSALALGADGLAVILDRQAGAPVCLPPKAAPSAPPTLLASFLLDFGQTCPLTLIIPSATDFTNAEVGALAGALNAAALRFPPRLVLPLALQPAAIAAGFDNICILNPYGDPSVGGDQAWSGSVASSRFPDHSPPGEAIDDALLVVSQGRSGQFSPVAWLVTDFGVPASLPPSVPWLLDSFADGPDGPHWVMGYSNRNKESTIGFGPAEAPALVIAMPEGMLYSGGGAVLARPIVTAFDARVRFRAERVAQGTTLELAAITVAPPQTSAISRDNPAADKYRSLVFDVHGAPPYVSCECDERDGFRLGWNTSYTVTSFQYDDSGGPASSNIYNQYGADVGGPLDGAVSGELRLARNGAVWAAYFRLDATAEWQCSGTRHLPGLPPAAYLRLAAKHWLKDKAPNAPANRVSFSDFSAHIPAWRNP